MGVLASGLGSCLRTELRSLFRATQTFSLRQTFCSYRSLTSANSLHTRVMQSAGQSCLPLTSVFCATSFREMRGRLNQVRTVFPAETVTMLDCRLESRRPSVCVSGRLRTLLIFVRACLLLRSIAFQIAVQAGPANPQNLRRAQAVSLADFKHALNMLRADFVQRQRPPVFIGAHAAAPPLQF